MYMIGCAFSYGKREKENGLDNIIFIKMSVRFWVNKYSMILFIFGDTHTHTKLRTQRKKISFLNGYCLF